MAKLPGWMVNEGEHWEGDHLVLAIRVRKWHPGFWWYALTTWMRRKVQGDGPVLRRGEK